MPVVEATESDFELIPEGTIVHARVKFISEILTLQGPRGDFEKLDWKFEITEGEFKGITVNDGTSPKFSIDGPSKLYEWASILLGRTFDLGERIDTDDLVGLSCRIEIGHKPGKDDPEKVWLRVETLMPASGAGSGSAEDVFG